MNGFIKKTILFLLPILWVVIFVNMMNNYATLFGKISPETNAKNLLVKGNIIKGFKDNNERIFQKLYINDSSSLRPNHIVLGSSRAMLINMTFTDSGYVFYNSSVPGGNLEDAMAIYQLWKNSRSEIRKITLEVNLTWFKPESHKNVLQTEYDAIRDDIYNEKKRFSFNGFDLLSLNSFKNTVQSFLFRDVQYATVCDSLDSGYLKFPDGSIRYPLEWYKNTNTQIGTWLNDYIYTELSPKRIELFSLFVNYLLKRNIKVELFINSFHPVLYDILKQKSPALNLVESFLNEFSKTHPDVLLFGSYNPLKYGFKDVDFIDLLHPKENVYETILKQKFDKAEKYHEIIYQ